MKRELDNVERKFEAKSQVLKKLNDDKAFGKANKVFTIKRDTLLLELEMINKEMNLIQAEEKAQRLIQSKQELCGVMKQIQSCEDKEYLSFLKIAGKISLDNPMLNFKDFETKFEEFEMNNSVEAFNDYNNSPINLRRCLNLCIERSAFDYRVDNNQTLSLNGYCGIKVDTYGNSNWNRCHISIRFPKQLSEL